MIRHTYMTVIIKQLALFKSSLLLKSYLQRTQTLQFNEIGNYIQKYLRPSKSSLASFRPRESNAEKCKHFNLESE